MNLHNKTLIVTGVASGIGAELARLARFQGATVIGVDRHEPQLTLDGFFQADLGDPASIDALVARLPARVHGLCNIAGVPGTAPEQAVATVNYGLAPGTKLGEMVEQARRSVVWLYRNAAELDIDPTRIHLAGHGAGAHLAMMAAVMPARPYELLGQPVRSAVGLGGVYDLEPVRLSFLNAGLHLDRDESWRLSPAHWPPPAACRVLVASGGRESLELRRQTRGFAASWREKGVSVETLELPGEDHFSLLGKLAAPDLPLGRAVLMQVLES